MTKIYVVTSGEYSSYSIEGVYSSRENCELMYGKEGNDYTFEEYDLDEFVDVKRKGWSQWRVIMDEAGNIIEATSTPHTYRNQAVNPAITKTRERILVAHPHAKDRTHAIKIANEMIAQYTSALKPTPTTTIP